MVIKKDRQRYLIDDWGEERVIGSEKREKD